MEKKLIIRFLNEKRKGVYNLLVEFYASHISSLSKTMACTLIEEDLEKECGSQVKLNYFSLARAISRYEKKHPKLFLNTETLKSSFKDLHQSKEGQSSPIIINVPPKK